MQGNIIQFGDYRPRMKKEQVREMNTLNEYADTIIAETRLDDQRISDIINRALELKKERE